MACRQQRIGISQHNINDTTSLRKPLDVSFSKPTCKLQLQQLCDIADKMTSKIKI